MYNLTASKLIPFICALLTAAKIDAAAPINYYESATGKTHQALRQALHEIIKDHHIIRYDSTGFSSIEALEMLDQDAADTNNIILTYSGWSVAVSTYGNEGWNREHLWPVSYGFDGHTTWPPYADLFILRPCESHVNSARGNKFFDSSDPADRNYRPSANANAPICSADTDSWEPPDSMKGDIARAIFYMDLRYAGDLPTEPDLIATDDVRFITSTNTYMGRLSTLLLWHRLDPVDGDEQRRNDLIFTEYQHNRNPFVDHPDWAEAIFLPQLTFTRSTNALMLAWEPDWPDAVLESTKNLPAAWSAVPTIPTNINGQVAVFVAATNQAQFFRLQIR